MKKIIQYSLLLLFLCSSTGLWAHQPNLSSTILMEKEDGQWIVQIRASLTAFEYEVAARFGQDAYKTAEEFKELVVRQIEQSLSVKFNEGESLKLNKPQVRLGHESSITFELEGKTENMNLIEVKNTSFEHISRNQAALVVLKKGFAKNQFMMNKENNHQLYLKAEDNKFEALDPKAEKQTNVYALVLLLGILLTGIAIFLLVNKQSKPASPKLNL